MSATGRLIDLAAAAGLGDVAERVVAVERLSPADGLRLYEADVHAVGALANHARERLHGDLAYFNVNQHIDYTNICNKLCRFCPWTRCRVASAISPLLLIARETVLIETPVFAATSRIVTAIKLLQRQFPKNTRITKYSFP